MSLLSEGEPFYKCPCFKFYKWSKKGNLIGYCEESGQTFDCPFHTIQQLEIEKRISYEVFYPYSLYLSVSADWYYVTGKEVLSYQEFKSKYFVFVRNSELELWRQLDARLKANLMNT